MDVSFPGQTSLESSPYFGQEDPTCLPPGASTLTEERLSAASAGEDSVVSLDRLKILFACVEPHSLRILIEGVLLAHRELPTPGKAGGRGGGCAFVMLHGVSVII